MDEFKRIWDWLSLANVEAAIHAWLPWDVGGSKILLWASVAAFIVSALVAAQLFGLFCGWLARRAVG
jgi:hypothetical protein